VRLMLPHVDDFLPVHNIRSLLDLARALASPPAERARSEKMIAARTTTTGGHPWK